MGNIIFDHVHKQASLKDYQKLEKYGILIDLNRITEHPPKDRCRFVSLKNGYLEFIEDRTLLGPFKRFCGMTKPGLCLSLEGESDLESFSKKDNIKQFDPYIYRRAYDWKKDPLGPGWTFLVFRKPVFSGLNLWFISYDKIELSNNNRKTNDAFVSEITLLYKNNEDFLNFESLTGCRIVNDIIRMDNINFKFKRWRYQKITAIESITISSLSQNQQHRILDRTYWDLSIIPR